MTTAPLIALERARAALEGWRLAWDGFRRIYTAEHPLFAHNGVSVAGPDVDTLVARARVIDEALRPKPEASP